MNKTKQIKIIEEKIEEIKKNLAEQENALEQLKREEIKDIITYNGFEWYIIEEKANSVVLLMKERLSEDLIKKMFTDNRMIDTAFDVRFSRDESNNDWRDSYIRQVLNTKFLEKFNIDELVLMKTSYDIDKVSEDYIRLITIEEMKKADLEKRKTSDNCGYWTMSPSRFSVTYTAANEFYATSVGYANYGWVTNGLGVRPVIEIKKTVLNND